MIVLKTAKEIELMKEACRISAEALKVAGEAVKPGVTTWEIDHIAYEYIKKHGLLEFISKFHFLTGFQEELI